MSNTPVIIWTEIPVKSLEAACDFYTTVFKWKMEVTMMGSQRISILNNASQNGGANLYEDEVAQIGRGVRIHLVIPDVLEEAIKRCEKAGGDIETPIIEIPEGRFVMARDLDKNPIALFEMKAD